MIPMSADEIKEYWHDFCTRKKVDPARRTAGDRLIEQDPEHWADHTMGELLDAVSAGGA